MFDLPFDFLSLAAAIVALIFARKALNQVAVLRARLDSMEALGDTGRRAQTCAAATARQRNLGIAHGSAASHPRLNHRSRGAANSARGGSSRSRLGSPRVPRRRRPRRPQPGFEERLGTRWVVWVGGLTLALGGFFLVSYSIEAGLLGPGVRIMLGGAVRAGAAGSRRMDPAQGKHLGDRGAADRQYSGDPHRRRHRGRVRDGLCRLCALRISWCPPPPSFCSASSRSARSPRRCCTGRRWPASASSAPS